MNFKIAVYMPIKFCAYLLVFYFVCSCSRHETTSITLVEEEGKRVEYKGLEFTLPAHWELQNSIFMDTVENRKTGEFAPGIVTPENGKFTGQDFITALSENKQIDFKETAVSFDGMPREILKTDSILLNNATWYYGLLKYPEHPNNFTYQYIYYGPFENKGVMINFYFQQPNEEVKASHQQLLESIEFVNK